MGRREQSYHLTGTEFHSLWDDEIVLETDSGDGCTGLSVYLKPLNCTLKDGYNGKFHVV